MNNCTNQCYRNVAIVPEKVIPWLSLSLANGSSIQYELLKTTTKNYAIIFLFFLLYPIFNLSKNLVGSSSEFILDPPLKPQLSQPL